MTRSISNTALSIAAMFGFATVIATASVSTATAADDLHQICRRVRNDDTVRAYSPALRDETLRAFKEMVPEAKAVPADDEFANQAVFRCMRGKIFVCLMGANLPCVKMNAARDNAGADAYCRGNPNADSPVPAAATGHDAVYSYRCHNGRAEITGEPWKLDERGFATKLWAELPDR
jgi:hypothetical protein